MTEKEMLRSIDMAELQRRVAHMRPVKLTEEESREMVKLIHRLTLLVLIAGPPWMRDVEEEEP